MKKTLVFDLGGVLIDWDRRYLYSRVFSDPVELEYFLDNVCTLEWNYQGDAGRPFAECIRELTALHPKYERQIAMWLERWDEMFSGPIQENVDLLLELDTKGYDLYSITNWSGEQFPLTIDRFGFLRKFKDIVVSGDEKITKPDPRIFEILFRRNKINPLDCIFIDDREINIKTACDLGMSGIWYQNPMQLRSDLTFLY